MPRADKVAVVETMRERLEESSATLLTEYRGLSVSDLAELRAELRKNDAEYQVVKNTLLRIAAREAGIDFPDSVLVGPTAITFCASDPVATAKVLRAYARSHPQLVIKAGLVEGRVLGAVEAGTLADLESREESLRRLGGMMQALVGRPAKLAQASLAKAAQLFGALHEKRVGQDQEAA